MSKKIKMQCYDAKGACYPGIEVIGAYSQQEGTKKLAKKV
jgi:hypothetical protein